MSYFSYECPNCDKELNGTFGEDVYCQVCNKTYETEWDYVAEDSLDAWIVKEKIEIK